jgi:hypothetical protein
MQSELSGDPALHSTVSGIVREVMVQLHCSGQEKFILSVSFVTSC